MSVQRKCINVLRKYKMVLKMAILKEMQYKLNFILSLLSAMIPMGMSLLMWQAIYKHSEYTFGYCYEEMLLYTILAVLVSQFVAAGFAMEIASDIKSGELSKFLCAPIGYLLYRLVYFIGSKIVSFVMSGMMLIGVILAFNSLTTFEMSAVRIVYFIVALFLGMLLNFVVFLGIGLTAFWFVETFYLFWALKEIILLTSGGLFPLEVYGRVGSFVLKSLPFQYTTYFPIHIVLGKLSVSEIQRGLLIQSFWLLLIGTIVGILWRKGIKNYVSVGG